MPTTWKLGVLSLAALLFAGSATFDAKGDEPYYNIQPAVYESSCLDACLWDPLVWRGAYDWVQGNNDYGIRGGGWTQIGGHSNETPLSTTRNDLAAFNDHGGRINLHQQWFWMEMDLCSYGGADLSLRSDLVYGTDAQKTQSFGGWGFDGDPEWDRNGGYGWALPQLFVQADYGDHLSVQLGHFYTIIGYEVVQAPQNFFYSHSLTMFNSEPFTHTGILGTYNYSDRLTLYGGWTAGWDTGFESVNDGSSFLGGFSYQWSDDVQFIYTTTVGNFGLIGDDGYMHSIVADITLTERLNYVFQSDLKRVDSVQRDTFGINQYLFYDLNDYAAVGGRIEWWKLDGNSQYETTGGVNVKLLDNLVFRPEYRVDWMPYLGTSQSTFGADMILTY